MKVGDKVVVTQKNLGLSGSTMWASRYIGCIGFVEGKCQIFPKSWQVRFPIDGGLASLRSDWLEKIK